MKDVLQVVTLNGLLRVEKIEEFLDELGSDVDLEGADLHGFVDHQLEEKLIDALEMGPRWVHLFLLVDTGLCEVQVAFLDVWQGTEDVLFNHLHDLVEVRDDHAHNRFLVLQHLLHISDCVETLSLHEKFQNRLEMEPGKMA